MGMSNAARKLLEGVLRLDMKERAKLATEIIASLDGPADPDASKAWEKEIQRRADAYFAGTMKTAPANEVLARVSRKRR